MKELVRKIVRKAIITLAGKDDGDFAIQQISYLGRVGDCEIVFPYGMHANLPPDALLLMFSVQGNSENRAAIGGVPSERIKDLPEKEVVFFHPFTKSKIHFRNNGDLDIEAAGDVGDINITCNDANLTASGNIDVNCVDAHLTASGNVGINCVEATVQCTTSTLIADQAVANISASFDITCPIVNINGALNVSGVITGSGGLAVSGGNGAVVNGDVEVNGTVTLSGALTSNGKNISDSHTHPYTWTDGGGAGNTNGVN